MLFIFLECAPGWFSVHREVYFATSSAEKWVGRSQKLSVPQQAEDLMMTKAWFGLMGRLAKTICAFETEVLNQLWVYSFA